MIASTQTSVSGRARNPRYAKLRRMAGNATLEAVIVMTLLVNITFGTIEFGYYFFVRNVLQNAARDGARKAIVANATEANVTTAVLNDLIAGGLLKSTATTVSPYTLVTSPSDVSTATVGSSVTVTVSGVWGTVGQGFRPLSLIGSAKVVSGVNEMRAETNGTNAP